VTLRPARWAKYATLSPMTPPPMMIKSCMVLLDLPETTGPAYAGPVVSGAFLGEVDPEAEWILFVQDQG
jgi:hypothetical protein